jgi:Ribonuclease G/E
LHEPSRKSCGITAATAKRGRNQRGQPTTAATNITEVNGHGAEAEDEVIESVGGADAMEEVPERMPRLRRQYKIQEVIKRRQVMLVQVVKEERGTKGARSPPISRSPAAIRC